MKPVPRVSQYKLQPFRSRQTSDSERERRETSGCLYAQAIHIHRQSIGILGYQVHLQMHEVGCETEASWVEIIYYFM